jgi:hypothetical protein
LYEVRNCSPSKKESATMTDLNAMWTALAAYQTYADQDGHGESWRKMCEERTREAAWVAEQAAWDAREAAAAHLAAYAAWEAARAASRAASAAARAARAAYAAAARAASRAAWEAAMSEAAARAAAEPAYWSELAISRIERAIKERNHD